VSGLGTAATRNVPAVGNASDGEVVLATDTRLTDSRTPNAHASTHATGGSDPLTPASIGAQAALTTAAPLAVNLGGTGSISYADGQLLIGNSATGGLTKATLTAGANVSITNSNGNITIDATGGGGSGQSPITQVFNASAYWSKPAGAKMVRVRLLGGGGGGGSGRLGLSGEIRCGGGGGGGGGYHEIELDASLLGASELVTVGGGALGGSAITAGPANGNSGGQGGNSAFGTWVRVQGGVGGQGGLSGGPLAAPGAMLAHFGGSASNLGGVGAAGYPQTLNGVLVSTPAVASSFFGPGGAGGGAGGGVSSANATALGGVGGYSLLSGATSPGFTPSTNGIPGTGGAGGFGSLSGASNGGAGGRASGGGGGGAGTGSGPSGAGGAGGAGQVIVTTYF